MLPMDETGIIIRDADGYAASSIDGYVYVSIGKVTNKPPRQGLIARLKKAFSKLFWKS